jgi:VWFA-related protein
MNSKPFWLSVLAGLVSATLSHAAFPQNPPGAGNAVNIVVTAVSPHGGEVPTLNREDVMVYEGRDRDTVTDWAPAQGEHAGLELFFLIDDNASTSLGSQLDDIRQFIRAQPQTTAVGIAYMQDGMARVVQNLTNDHEQATKALRLPMGGATINASPYFSLSDLIKRWPQDTARHEVVMVSDGTDRFWGSGPDDPYVDTAVDDAQRAGVIVYAIYTPGSGYRVSYWRYWWGQNYLSRVADETGGEGYYIGFTGNSVSFEPFLDDVGQRLQHQYWLGFLPKSQKKAGFQKVKLNTEVPHVHLVAQDRVYVPPTQ